MSKVIHRHRIPQAHEPFDLPIPDDAEIVHVGFKGDGTLGLWETHRDGVVLGRKEPRRRFQVVATGQPYDGIHCGTFIAGDLVWHLMEVAR